MAHDQTFKEILQNFFQEFMELFFPKAAVHLDFSKATFPDKEIFSGFPRGSKRELDFVAQVHTIQGTQELILVHIEVQAKRERQFSYRMYEYYSLLRLKHKTPVYPIVLYLAPGVEGITFETYRESLFDEPILAFHYRAIGLPFLDADEYLKSDNPLAHALAALMKPSAKGRGYQKAVSVNVIVSASISEPRKVMLLSVLDSYLKLSEREAQEYDKLISRETKAEVTQMATIYEERGMKKGLKQGRIQAKQELVLKALTHKFGAVPEQTIKNLEAIQDEKRLDKIYERLLDAKTLEELEI